MVSDNGLHPGISVHHIEVGGGVAGTLVAAISTLIFLIGVPALWYFLGGAIALGLPLAGVFHFLHRRDADPLPKFLS